MRTNLPVTQKNVDLRHDTRIVSTTNEAGQITHVNQDFIDISGFSEDELLLKPHNVIRHPDMPGEAFEMMWDSLKADKSWIGIVKNRCKNGDHYWVDALATPLKLNGKTEGYQSVRMKPSEAQIDQAEKVYKKINEGKNSQPINPSLLIQLLMLIIATVISAIIPMTLIDEQLLQSLASLVVASIVGCAGAFWIAAPWQRAAAASKAIIDDPVAMATYTNRSDELGQLQLTQHMLNAKLQTVIWRLSDSAISLEEVSNKAVNVAQDTANSMSRQKNEVEQVATAITQMASSVGEVAQNASAAAGATENAKHQVADGKNVVEQAITTTSKLASSVQEASGVILGLADVTDAIGGVVEMIRSIAEQTNLLALNAAIEAARAGEQGRGFAVVADEVRSLASKTQTSTDEIQTMIQKLQTATDKAVKAMEQGKEVAENNVANSILMGESFDSIDQAVDQLSSMVVQIAKSSEEQGAFAEEINRNVINIHSLSEETQQSTQESHQSINELQQQIQRLRGIVNQFSG
ncbi:methyl-accepting chemotaxis protein [Agarilytica rhodophyticola]|uniref:methyl-accepting chemotaxis protein n=1 Tax=Agarilytica rhodophyticola TaxID=1737490 RepID=UPI00131563F9|nr:PAS domain-containing methyl-accepting chemotaxis protein [Agarilytica rhodophyticola]